MPSRPHHDQRQIDFSRAEQLNLLTRSQLPGVTIQEGKQRRRIKPKDMKLLLRTIDNYARGKRSCWPTINTLAQDSQMSGRDVRRTLRGLQSLDLVAVRARGPHASLYAINWTELARLNNGPTPESPAQIGESPAQLDKSPAQMSKSPAHLGQQKRETFQETPPPPSPSSNADWKEVEEALVKVGLAEWHAAATAAQAAQVTPGHVLQIVEHFRAAGGAYGAGALYCRIRKCHPELRPQDGWPSMSPPSAGVEKALRTLQQCRNHEKAAGMPEDTFRKLYRKELASKGLETHFQEALFREREVQTVGGNTPCLMKNCERSRPK